MHVWTSTVCKFKIKGSLNIGKGQNGHIKLMVFFYFSVFKKHNGSSINKDVISFCNTLTTGSLPSILTTTLSIQTGLQGNGLKRIPLLEWALSKFRTISNWESVAGF